MGRTLISIMMLALAAGTGATAVAMLRTPILPVAYHVPAVVLMVALTLTTGYGAVDVWR